MMIGLSFALTVVSFIATANDWTSFGGNTNVSYTTTENLTFPLTKDWMYQCDHPPVPTFKNLSREAYNPNAFGGEQENVTKLDFVSYPVIYGKNICFADISDASVVCLDTDSGKTNWIFSVNASVRVCPTIYDNKLYFGADRIQCAFAANKGKNKNLRKRY